MSHTPKPLTIPYKVRIPEPLHGRFKAAVALDTAPESKYMHTALIALITRYTEYQESLRTSTKPSNQHYQNA